MAHAKPIPKPKPRSKSRPSFQDLDKGKGPPPRGRPAQGRPVKTQKVTTKPVKTRKVTTKRIPVPNQSRKTDRDIANLPQQQGPRQGAVAKAAERIRNTKTVKGFEKLLKDFQDDPVAFALANPRKPIRQAQLPQGTTPTGNRQLAATKFGPRQRKQRRSAKVTRRKR